MVKNINLHIKNIWNRYLPKTQIEAEKSGTFSKISFFTMCVLGNSLLLYMNFQDFFSDLGGNKTYIIL